MKHAEDKNATQDAASRHAERVLRITGSDVSVPATELRTLLESYRRLLDRFRKVMRISDTYGMELKKVTGQLEQLRALALPICMFCKKIRVDEGYWQQMETYFARHIDVAFTHGICPDCMREKYGEIANVTKARERLGQEIREIARRGEARQIPDADQYVSSAEALLDSPDAPPETVRTGLRRLSDRYRRLLRRMGKILLISDGYQARLMDLNARLDLLAHTDGLTKLFNRADATEKLEVERSRAERHGSSFSVILTDVDDFKRVNDEQGHEAGDLVLMALARSFASAIRREDTCARWGGEEFLFLLPEASASEAEAMARKLLEAARSLAVPYRGALLRCTLSAGVAPFRPGASLDDILRGAEIGRAHV
jgi:diguanylate cyclase (GGDEF)-like protein